MKEEQRIDHENAKTAHHGDCCGRISGFSLRLSALGIDTKFHAYPGLSHSFGLGTGTAAEGWLDDAVSFWEKQMESPMLSSTE